MQAILQTIGALVLLGNILIVILLFFLSISYLSKTKISIIEQSLSLLRQNSLPFAFLIASAATVGSLFLSEVAKFPPCKLCWYQRIFMYPQAVILGVALFTNDSNIRKYVVSLSFIGLAIAVYHYILQRVPNLPCSDEVANCSLKQVEFYGFITIPWMSATAFLLILIILLISIKKG